VTRHDHREWVLPEGLADIARLRRVAEPGRDVAVRQRRAGRDRAGDRVDRSVKIRDAGLVEDDAGQVDRLAVEQRNDAVDRGAHRGRRRVGLDVGKPAPQAGDGPLARRFRQLQRHDAARSPGDRAGADRGVEEGVAGAVQDAGIVAGGGGHDECRSGSLRHRGSRCSRSCRMPWVTRCASSAPDSRTPPFA
jgi:hypothetical protein